MVTREPLIIFLSYVWNAENPCTEVIIPSKGLFIYFAVIIGGVAEPFCISAAPN